MLGALLLLLIGAMILGRIKFKKDKTEMLKRAQRRAIEVLCEKCPAKARKVSRIRWELRSVEAIIAEKEKRRREIWSSRCFSVILVSGLGVLLSWFSESFTIDESTNALHVSPVAFSVSFPSL